MKNNLTSQSLVLAAIAALSILGHTAQAQTPYYLDVNGPSTAGFGDLSIKPDGTNPNIPNQGDHFNLNGTADYTTDSGGLGTAVAFTNSFSNSVVIDLSQTTASPYGMRVNNAGANNLGGISLVNAGTKTFSFDPAAFSPRTLNFNGGTINVGDSGSTLTFGNSGYISLEGNFTLTGAGTLDTGMNTSASGAYVGTATLSGGTFRLDNSTGLGTGSNIILSGGTLKINNTGANTVGSLTGGSGTVTSANSGSLAVVTALKPNGTLNLNLSAAAAFDISGIAAHGLQFNLSSPGSSDEVVFQGFGGALNIGNGVIGLSSFTFGGTPTAGTYTLFDTSQSAVGIVGSGLNPLDSVGTVDGYLATLTDDGTDIDLTLVAGPAVPEPSTYAMLLGGFAALGVYMRRRAV